MDFILQSRRVIKGRYYKPLKINETGDNSENTEEEDLSSPDFTYSEQRQSRRVIKGKDYKPLKINETGDNSDNTEEEDLSSHDFTYSELRKLPVYNDNAATTLGLKYSSRVSRSGHPVVCQNRNETCGPHGDSSHPYDVFEDPQCLSSVKDLPHPSELFGKCKRKGVKRKEQPNSVAFHISQLRSKRKIMNDEIEASKTKTLHQPQKSVDKNYRVMDKEEYSNKDRQNEYDIFHMEPYFPANKKPRLYDRRPTEE